MLELPREFDELVNREAEVVGVELGEPGDEGCPGTGGGARHRVLGRRSSDIGTAGTAAAKDDEDSDSDDDGVPWPSVAGSAVAFGIRVANAFAFPHSPSPCCSLANPISARFSVGACEVGQWANDSSLLGSLSVFFVGMVVLGLGTGLCCCCCDGCEGGGSGIGTSFLMTGAGLFGNICAL